MLIEDIKMNPSVYLLLLMMAMEIGNHGNFVVNADGKLVVICPKQ